jgi:hypothetical protein
MQPVKFPEECLAALGVQDGRAGKAMLFSDIKEELESTHEHIK